MTQPSPPIRARAPVVRPRAAAGPAAHTVPAPAALLARQLQQTVGNHAAARLLAPARVDRPEVSIGASRVALDRPRQLLLQRFALTVTTVPNPGGAGGVVVERVRIGDRPPGLFGSAHKSHAVGWETFCDGLRLEIMGQTPRVALARVEALYQFVLQLPGMARVANLPQADPAPRAAHLVQPVSPAQHHARAAARALAAHNAAAAVLAAPGATTISERLAALQEFAAAYLQLRNTVPQAAVILPNPSGGADLGPIREHETGVRAVPAVELRTALWDQLDRRVVARLALAATGPRLAPGISTAGGVGERQARVRDVVRDHLASMQASYPVSYARAQLGSAVGVRRFLRSIAGDAGNDQERLAFPPAWVAPLVGAITGGAALPTVAAGPGRVAVAGLADPGKRFAIQLDVVRAGGLVTVRDMQVGGRPRGVFGGVPGSHTSAWSLLTDRVRERVRGQTLANANARLLGLGGPLRIGRPNRVANMGALATQEVLAAQTAYDAALLLVAPVPVIVRLQALARAVLMLLNTEPIGAVQTGGLANAANESRHRIAARAANVPGPAFAGGALATVRGHLWGLLDLGALNTVLDPTFTRVEVPGTKVAETAVHRATYVIRRHMALISGAYPDAYARAQLDRLPSVMGMLTTVPLNVPRADAITIARALIGGLGAPAAGQAYDQLHAHVPAPVAARGTKRGRGNNDDDDYIPR